jgi:hypothetical protein
MDLIMGAGASLNKATWECAESMNSIYRMTSNRSLGRVETYVGNAIVEHEGRPVFEKGLE